MTQPLARAWVKRPPVQILVVVANIQMDAPGTDIQRPRYFFQPFSKSKDCDEVVEWQETGSKSSKEHEQLLYFCVQLEYCEKGTLRNLIDEGLHENKEGIWRLFREIVNGLVYIHSQVMHKRLINMSHELCHVLRFS